jgi:hypothetical protein
MPKTVVFVWIQIVRSETMKLENKIYFVWGKQTYFLYHEIYFILSTASVV